MNRSTYCRVSASPVRPRAPLVRFGARHIRPRGSVDRCFKMPAETRGQAQLVLLSGAKIASAIRDSCRSSVCKKNFVVKNYKTGTKRHRAGWPSLTRWTPSPRVAVAGWSG
jgi:hypothetical protein